MDKGIDDLDNAIETINNNMVQSDTINDTTKYPSAAVTYQHGIEIDNLGNNKMDSDMYVNWSTNTTNYANMNIGFISSGHYKFLDLYKHTIKLQGQIKTTKSAQDWIMCLHSSYTPASEFYFTYYLGSVQYSGHVVDGYVYFSTLNTTDTLSFDIEFPYV